jgi:hypothetical protein
VNLYLQEEALAHGLKQTMDIQSEWQMGWKKGQYPPKIKKNTHTLSLLLS